MCLKGALAQMWDNQSPQQKSGQMVLECVSKEQCPDGLCHSRSRVQDQKLGGLGCERFLGTGS